MPTSPTSPSTGPEQVIFISGKVVIADGTPTPSNITIQRVCSGAAHAVAYTDAKGRFSFQWGDTRGVMMDASESGGFGGPGMGGQGGGGMGGPGGMSAMNGCELRASLPGFQSDLVSLTDRRAMDNPDIGTIVLHRMAAVEGTSISATTLAAPKDAKKFWEKGVAEVHKKKSADAVKDLGKAVELYPKFAQAWLDLGRAQLDLQQTEPAREAFLKAADADAKLVEPWAQLGLLASRDQNWKDSAQYLDKALKLDPVDFPQLWFPDAIANYNIQNFDAAERAAREAIKMDPQKRNPRVTQLLGLALVQKHDYPAATQALQEYIRLAPDAKDLNDMKQQLAAIAPDSN